MGLPEIEELEREVGEAKARLVEALGAHVPGAPTAVAIALFDRYLDASHRLAEAKERLAILKES